MNFIVFDLGLKRVNEVRIYTSVNYLLYGSLNDSLLFGVISNGSSWHLHDFGYTVSGSLNFFVLQMRSRAAAWMGKQAASSALDKN